MKRKNVLFTAMIMSSIGIYAQENVLPATGNVGLGTLNPTEKLDVHGNAVIKQNLTVENGVTLPNLNSNQNLNGDVLLVDEQGTLTRGDKTNFAEHFGDAIYEEKDCGIVDNPTWANGLNKIYTYCPEVNVGINTNAPRVKLDVNGTAYAQKLAIGNLNPSGSLGYFHLKTNLLGTNPATVFVIENAERPILQLGNDGLLRIRELKLNQQTWADFVFEPTYSLRSLADLEKYILLHKHLPDVPSAEEVAAEGMDVGEMQQVFLQKIEELTLYLIELNKQLVEQQAKIAVLERQLNH